MIRSIAQKEIQSALRDRRFLIISGVILLLLMTSIFTGYQSFNALQAERKVAQKHAEDDFNNQPDRHPHRVAHYGSYAFRPKSALSFLDPGLDPYTGSMVYLEAHQQNSANFSQAQQSGALLRLSDMSMAFVMQWLVPLLIIFLCFNAFSHERTQGTLKLLTSQGVSLRQIAKGKIAGYCALIAFVIVPAYLVAIICALFTSEETLSIDLLLRLAVLLAGYTVYFFIFIVATVLVSGISRESKTALVSLLGVWILFFIVMPKITVSVAESHYQIPSRAEMESTIHFQAKNGIDGHNPQDERTKAFTESLLKKYKVDSVKQLPIDLGGLVMAEGEEFSSKLYQKHFDELIETYEKQNQMSIISGLINPFQSIKNLSMAMSGSDFKHYLSFLNAAEDYRYNLSQHLNNLQAYKLGNKPKNTRLDKSNYSSYPPFSYQAPNFSQAIQSAISSILMLLIWAIGIYFVAILLLQKISVI